MKKRGRGGVKWKVAAELEAKNAAVLGKKVAANFKKGGAYFKGKYARS